MLKARRMYQITFFDYHSEKIYEYQKFLSLKTLQHHKVSKIVVLKYIASNIHSYFRWMQRE
jgi:hypothetical protein